jgi:MscS family membrane protein
MATTVQVGDFCRAGEFLGLVDDIGLRSTRLRTVDRTIVSIPNGQLATMSLENFTLRDRIRFRHLIGLRYETAADQLRYVLDGIYRLLQSRFTGCPCSVCRVREFFSGCRDPGLHIDY